MIKCIKKTITAILVILILCSCAADGEPKVRGVITTNGATVNAPTRAPWISVPLATMWNGVMFAAIIGNKGETASAAAQAYRLNSQLTDADFFNSFDAERTKMFDENTKQRYKLLKTEKVAVQFKGATCSKYQTLRENIQRRGNSQQFLNVVGYLCRHPLDKAVAFDINVGYEANLNSFSAEMTSITDEYFNSLEFNEKVLSRIPSVKAGNPVRY